MTVAVCRCHPRPFRDVAEKSTAWVGSCSLLSGVRLVGPLAGGEAGRCGGSRSLPDADDDGHLQPRVACPRPRRSRPDGQRAVELAGTAGVRISPGDIDEAVTFLLTYGLSDRVFPNVDASGFELLRAFRNGFLRGGGPCDVGLR